jgi:WD40 repeat protein
MAIPPLECFYVATIHSSFVHGLAFSPVDPSLFGSVSGSITACGLPTPLLNAQSGISVGHLEGAERSQYHQCIAFSVDGHRIACGSSSGTIKVFDSTSKTRIAKLICHDEAITSVAFCPMDSNLLATASRDGSVRIWNVAAQTCISKLMGHTDSVYGVACSVDGTLVASASSDQTVRLWDVRTAGSSQPVAVLKGHTDVVFSVAFSPNSTQLTCERIPRRDRSLWDSLSHKCTFVISDHTASVNAVAFSADGRFLASASDDKSVRLWDAKSGRCLSRLAGHTGNVSSLAFSCDGTVLASGARDHTVRLWRQSQPPRTD